MEAELQAPSVVRVEHPHRSPWFVLAKRFVQVIFLVLVAPRLISYYVCRIFRGRRAFAASSESIARVPGLRGVYMRQAFYRQTLSSCGRDVYFGWLSVFSMPEARVGDRAYIGRFCSLGYADLGDEVMLADGVQILSGGREHGRDQASAASMQAQSQTFQQVRVHRGAWVGAAAVVMADVGEGTVVGAGAVVNKPLPDFALAVGVPARVLRQAGKERVVDDK